MSDMVEQALKRPSDYANLTPAHQWSIDADLGILDWDPTREECEEYARRRREQAKSEKDEQP